MSWEVEAQARRTNPKSQMLKLKSQRDEGFMPGNQQAICQSLIKTLSYLLPGFMLSCPRLPKSGGAMDTLHIALRCLRHPATLVSIGLLLLNDHVLKAAAPSPLTGKLSDFAGLSFFPFVLAAALSLISDRVRVSARAAGALAFALTGVWFALTKTSPWANALTEAALSRVLGFPARVVLDPGDALALLMLYPAWRLWINVLTREPARARPERAASCTWLGRRRGQVRRPRQAGGLAAAGPGLDRQPER